VAVGDGDFGTGGDGELEHGERGQGVGDIGSGSWIGQQIGQRWFRT
jgi:hypothetical protein